jgi:hypothetical protein
MAVSFFDDKAHPPSDADLAKALGKSLRLWNRAKVLVHDAAGDVAEEWGYASKSTGWGFRLKQGKRVLLYMTPCDGHFLASTALGEKAVARAVELEVPPGLTTLIESAPKYAEGRGIRFPVKGEADLALLKHLIQLKTSV